MKHRAMIFKIQRYCIHDGPGIRTTVFFKGCPLRCQWCHNPESQQKEPDLMFHEHLCTRCGFCFQSCQHHVHTIDHSKHLVDFTRCQKCGACIEHCLTNAVSIVGELATVDDIMDVILKDRDYYIESGGGVTFSGGEPLLQPEVLKSLVDECAKRNISTYLDTCGYAKQDTFVEIVEKVDGILFDLKIMDSEKHRRYTGVENTLILENFKAACQLHTDLYVRTVIIPGITDDAGNLEQIADFLKDNQFFGEIELLPYHRYGHSKCRQLGLPYELPGAKPPSSESLQHVTCFFEKRGFQVRTG